MAGKASRVGNTRCLNSFLMGAITSGTPINPVGDLIGALSATLATGVATTLACAASGGGAVLTKAIPDKCTVIIADAAGAVDTMELVCVNGAQASAAASITFQSQTIRVAHPAGSGIWLVSFKPWLALTSTAPSDNALGTECTITEYARQIIIWTKPTVADPPVNASIGVITYGPLTSASGAQTLTSAELMDNVTGGTAANMYAYWTLTASKTPGAGDSLQVAAAALTMAMS